METFVNRWHRAGDRLHHALIKKWEAEEEYLLALAEIDEASRELFLDAARWARELQVRVMQEREIILEGGSPNVTLP